MDQQPLQIISAMPADNWGAILVPTDGSRSYSVLLMALCLMDDLHTGERRIVGWGVDGLIEEHPDFFEYIESPANLTRYQDKAAE